MLSNIYDSYRLEEEVGLLTAASESDVSQRNSVGFFDAFRFKEIRLAFLAGGGLQVSGKSLSL